MFYVEKTSRMRRTRNRLLVFIAALLIVSASLTVLYNRASHSQTRIREVLIYQGIQEIRQAREYAQQLSRIGGTYTTAQISLLRQHLYALRQLNAITASLYGANRGVSDDAQVIRALENVSVCEQRLLSGKSIDEQLIALSTLLDQISTQITQLSGG